MENRIKLFSLDVHYVDNEDNSNFADDARKSFNKMIMNDCISDDKLFYETIK